MKMSRLQANNETYIAHVIECESLGLTHRISSKASFDSGFDIQQS